MKSLISFIIRNSFILLFLILEGISVFFVVRFNGFQQNTFYKHYGNLSGKLDESTNNFKQYFYLKKENELLLEENARLKSQSETLITSSKTESYIVHDTISGKQFRYQSAKVVRNSVSHRHNYLVLDIGLKDGIKPDMAVVSERGVVGITKDVSTNFSTVISVLNPKAFISAKHKDSQMEGSINWNGRDYSSGALMDIPSHIRIEHGDSIVTSGNSFIFPEDIPIGTISSFEEDQGSKFYHINILFANDFKSLHHIYVIENMLQDEQMNLLNQSIPDDE